MKRLILALLCAISALWPLWAMLIDALVRQGGGGFLSWGDLVTLRTPVIVVCIFVAFLIGRSTAAREIEG